MAADLYDELDPLYRAIWGDSLHHGLWVQGSESIQEARENLAELVLAALPSTGTIADIGCGYGTLAHRLATTGRYRVLANTHSPVQAARIPSHPALDVRCGDWLAQSLPPHSLDAAIAVESLSYFPSFDRFLDHTGSALKPGSRLVIADWYSDHGTSALLRRLASVGDLPPWRPLASLLASARDKNWRVVETRKLSALVAPTWSKLFRRSLLTPFRHPRLLPLLFRQARMRPFLLPALPLLRLAYHTGDLAYHLVVLEKQVSR